MKLTYAFRTYNRADRLEILLATMRSKDCSAPYEILAANNNSHTNLDELATYPGGTLRYVTEPLQGIAPDRNRTTEQSLESNIPVFINNDKIPQPWLLLAARGAFQFPERQEVILDKHTNFSHKLIWSKRRRMTIDALLKPGYESNWKRDLSAARAIFRHTMHIHRADAGLGPTLGEFLSATMRKSAQSDSHTPGKH